MIQDFLHSHLNRAKYEIIDEGKTYYGEIPALKGVWATGKTLEECRNALLETLEGWMILRLKKSLPIPNFKIPYKEFSSKSAYA